MTPVLPLPALQCIAATFSGFLDKYKTKSTQNSKINLLYL